MLRLYDCCCGIDVHKKIIVACMLKGRKKEIRSFDTYTSALYGLCDWLQANGCEAVAMESTGSYWKPLYNVLEDYEIHSIVVNAQHMKAVPGRKTDVSDSEWICDLLQHGLLMASYIPSKDQRELRELCTYRKSLVKDKASETNRVQKMLEGANIKLSGTVSDINGKSARTLLRLALDGEVLDEARIQELKAKKLISNHLKADPKRLAEDLNGVFSKAQSQMIKVALSHIDELDHHIAELNKEIGEFMDGGGKEAVNLLKTIPGISDQSAQQIVAVIGTDMSRFPTAAHLCSWAGIAPGNNESAGKRRPARTTKGNKLLKTTLILCAHSAVMVKDSYLKAQYDRLAIRRGKKRAIVAVAHSMLVSIWHMLGRKQAYVDLGSDYFNQFNKEKKMNSYLKKLESLGYKVTVNPLPA